MIKFTKMHGLGNDYVYMDAIHQHIENESSLAQFVSNRNFGIGSDGLILICKSEKADFPTRLQVCLSVYRYGSLYTKAESKIPCCNQQTRR